MNTEICPDSEVLKELVNGGLTEDQRHSVEEAVRKCEQIQNCERCKEVLNHLNLADEPKSPPRPIEESKVSQVIITNSFDSEEYFFGESDFINEQITTVISETGRESPKTKSAGEEVQHFLALPKEAGRFETLGGYRLLNLMGVGGMGLVFRAEDPQLKRLVALKALKPSVAEIPSARERFLREAQVTASLDHDHIVQIYHVGEDRNIPFFVMPFLEGESLRSRVKREHRLTQREAIRIAREIAEGLSAAHEHDLIHRDVKPDNIWIEALTGRTKLLDFGIVRNTCEIGERPHRRALFGTPRYMSPQQALGEDVDHRSDLFSLGSVLYEMVSGKSPFDCPDLTETLAAVIHLDPQPVAEFVSGVHPAISVLLTELLAKNIQQRPQSAKVVAERLASIE